ncbi:MAG: baseplate J/gp47 family protein [Nitrosomonadales bacterium]|nr:baseplate J/gp47 family protein [Nitrosomonadales bacterium]
MTIPTKDYRQIRADILRDIANQQPAAYTGEDSDFAVRANAVASSIEGLYEHQKWIVRQFFPDTSDSDYLERHASLRGITRKAAAFATGTIRFSGTAGSNVPIGTEAKTNSGIAFVATASGVIGAGGTVDIAAQAVLAGLAGNQAADTALTLSAAPSGVLAQASIVAMTGGTDIESDAELLARVLYDLRLPPLGGAKHDYFAWAMEVPGVADAYVFTQRRAINGVDVVIETAGGLPGAQLIADVTAYIDSVRPACVDLLVVAPTLVTVNIVAVLTLSGTTLADATTRINSVLQTYFATLHVGDAVTRAKLISLMMGVKGVTDVSLTAPAANVVPLADATHSELAALGTVTLT